MTESRYSRGLGLLVAVCVILLIPATAVWLVNLELALQAAGASCTFSENLLPAGLYSLLTPFAADLSTISTLVPLLLLAFPAFMGIRIRVLAKYDPGYLRRVVYDPYPPHFPFFLVMLGLTGTLYGLLIGLSVSGVEELGAVVPTAGSIQGTIDRLMGGTATALLSSLLGLVGAFLAARPLTWIFRRAAGITEEETQRTVVEVVASLTHDLQSLGHASREFSESLNVAAAEGINQQLAQIGNSLSLLADGMSESNTRLQKLLEVQERTAGQMELMNHLRELERLEKIENASAAASERLAETRGILDKLRLEQERTNSTAGRLVEEVRRGHTESQESLDRIQALIDAGSRDSREERNALRKALGNYIQNLTEERE